MALDKYFPVDAGVRIIAEPGRFYVASAYTLVVNIIAKKVIIDDDTASDGNRLRLTDATNSGMKLSLNVQLGVSKYQQAACVSCAEEDEGTIDKTLMYYVNDGVYGSFNCILYDHAHCLPTLHKVGQSGQFCFAV